MKTDYEQSHHIEQISSGKRPVKGIGNKIKKAARLWGSLCNSKGVFFTLHLSDLQLIQGWTCTK